jgi:hypothetical protein
MKKPPFFAIIADNLEVYCEPGQPAVARFQYYILAVVAIERPGFYQVFDLATGEHSTAQKEYIFSGKAAILNAREFAEVYPAFWLGFLRRYPEHAQADKPKPEQQ